MGVILSFLQVQTLVLLPPPRHDRLLVLHPQADKPDALERPRKDLERKGGGVEGPAGHKLLFAVRGPAGRRE